MHIKLTDKAREALLFAELIAWARNHAQVMEEDLLIALNEQRQTVAKSLHILKSDRFNFETIDIALIPDIRKDAPLKFNKIPLCTEILNALDAAALENSQIAGANEINTGQLLIGYVFQNKQVLQTLRDLKTDVEEFKDKLLATACESRLIDDEIKAGHSTLSRFNRAVLNWLREENLNEQIKTECGFEESDLISRKTISKFLSFFTEKDNREIPDIKPPLKGGIKDKARRDLEVMDSFVAARNLPNPDPDLLGMYIFDPSQFLLFFENEMTYVSGESSQSIKYETISDLDYQLEEDENPDGKAIASLTVIYGDDLDFEVDVTAKTNDDPDVIALYNFLMNSVEPQSIIEIEGELDYLRFLRRQSKNMDLYYRLAYRTEELFSLTLWDREPSEQDVILFRLVAAISTLPLKLAGINLSN